MDKKPEEIKLGDHCFYSYFGVFQRSEARKICQEDIKQDFKRKMEKKILQYYKKNW